MSVKWDDAGSLMDYFESTIGGLSGGWIEKKRRTDTFNQYNLTKTYRFNTDRLGEYSVWGASNRKLFVCYFRFWTPGVFIRQGEDMPTYLAGHINVKTGKGEIVTRNQDEYTEALKTMYWAHYKMKSLWPYG